MSRTYNETGGGKTFYTIVDGKFANRANEGDEGAVKREQKNGNVVWEILNTGIIGRITSGCIAKKELNGVKFQEIQINIDDDAMLQIPMYMLKDIAEYLKN